MRIGIIGLGAAGAATAAYLAAQGHTVFGFEQFTSPHPYGSSHGENRMLRRYPGEGPEYVALMDWAYPLWQNLAQQAKQQLFVPCGTLEAVLPAEDWANQASLTDLLVADNVRQYFPLFSFPSDAKVFWRKQSGYVLAEASLHAWLNQARGAGAQLHMQTAVVGIDAHGRCIRLHGGATVEVDYTVVCAGSWVRRLVEVPVKVERRVLAWYPYRTIPASIPPGFAVIGPDIAYGMPSPDGKTYKIGHHQHFNEVIDNHDVVPPVNTQDLMLLNRVVADYLTGLVPTPERTAVCKYTMTANEDFIIDFIPDQPKVLVVSACSGHGFKYMPAIGRLVNTMLVGGNIPFAVDRFRLSAHRG